MQFHPFCQILITLYDNLSERLQRINDFLEKHFAWLMSHHVSRQDYKDAIKELGYDDRDIFLDENQTISAESKCYMILLSPLILIVILALLRMIYAIMFEKNTILLMYQIVKLMPLIIPFLIVFVGILPYLFFKFVRIEGRKNARVYAHGVLIAFVFPLLVLPQIEYLLHAKPFSIEGVVGSVGYDRKNRYLILDTNITHLGKLTLRGVDEITLRLVKKGDQYAVMGKSSKYYLTWDRIKHIGRDK